MTLPDINGPGAALIAGLITSLHCVGMCGPLACAVCPKGGGKDSMEALAGYHGMRIFSYTTAGLAAGYLGERLAPIWSSAAVSWIPWVFVVLFVAIALGLDKLLPFYSGAAKWVRSFLSVTQNSGGVSRASALGAVTPLIPCGPLYMVLGVSLMTGSMLGGGILMFAFALGTIPLAFVAQTQLMRLGHKLNPRTMGYLQRGLALVAAAMIVVRLMSGEPLGTEWACPMCH